MGEYVDRTGTDEKPDPMNNVFLEFPLAMEAVAKVTAFGAKKHAPRGWRSFKPDYAIKYHHSKIGRHLLARETEGDINETDGGCDHMAAVAWNALACLEQIIRQRRGLSMEDLPRPLPIAPTPTLSPAEAAVAGRPIEGFRTAGAVRSLGDGKIEPIAVSDVFLGYGRHEGYDS